MLTMPRAGILLALAAVQWAAAQPPNCRYIPRGIQPVAGGDEQLQDGVVCSCRGKDAGQPGYEGNLNFLKAVLTAVPPERRCVYCTLVFASKCVFDKR